MPTGLTADIYEGKSTSLRAFALNCVRQLGAGYYATNQGEKMMPLDKAPVMIPSDYYRKQLAYAEEQLSYWQRVKDNPDELQRLYDEEQTKHEQENIDHDARMKAVKERYDAMTSRVEQWQVPEQYASLKQLMLDQLRESLEFDYRPQYRPYTSPPEPMDEWVKHNIEHHRRNIDYHKEKMVAEQKRFDELNAYLQGLYDLLDEVEPYKEGL